VSGLERIPFLFAGAGWAKSHSVLTVGIATIGGNKFALIYPKALFTSPVFSPPKDVGIRGNLVFT
jgi:hypothetical protein